MKGNSVNCHARIALAVAFLSLSASSAAADSPLRLQAGATARTDDLAAGPGFTLGGAIALARWAPLSSIALVPQLELYFARRNARALAGDTGAGSPFTGTWHRRERP